MLTTIQIYKQISTRLPHPYGHCIESGDINHSFSKCIGKCYRDGLTKQCNCVYSPINSHVDNSSFQHCFNLNQSTSQLYQKYKCYEIAIQRITHSCYTICKYRCVTTQYSTEASYSKWPLSSQCDSFYEQIIAPRSFGKKFAPLFQRNSSPQDDISLKINELYKSKMIEDNFVQIQFSPEYLVYLETIEVPRRI